MKWRKLLLMLFFLSCLCCVGTTIAVWPRHPVYRGDFPDTDIVFQLYTGFSSEESDNTVGFVNADGSGLTHLPITVEWPVTTGDGSTLIYRDPRGPRYPGDLVVLRAGQKEIICEGWFGSGRVLLAADQIHSIVYVVGPPMGLALFNLDTCQEDDNELPNALYNENVLQYHPGNGAISPDGHLLAFEAWPEEHQGEVIIVHNLDTGKQTLVAKGCSPAWSTDGQWLTYTGVDGIYIVKADGTNQQRLVEYQNPSSGGKPAYYESDWPPLPTWSPDGEWLVYHKCIVPIAPKASCSGVDDYAIFKVNVETGEETKIVDGGINPYWRWREESP